MVQSVGPEGALVEFGTGAANDFMGVEVWGKTATTFSLACNFLSSRQISIWFASRTDSPCHNRAWPE
jgi:hypothetical protein